MAELGPVHYLVLLAALAGWVLIVVTIWNEPVMAVFFLGCFLATAVVGLYLNHKR